LLSWIPLLGPILQGLFNTVTSIYSKFKDTQLGMREQEVAEAKVSEQIIHDTNDDVALRIMRDAAIFPVVVWSMLIGWDTIIAWSPVAELRNWNWPIPPYPPSVGYLPYVVLVFLFGNIGLNIWKRK
jgi:hypothetical protein